MDSTKKFRYPGAPPFSYEDRQVFFGRDEDIDRLYKFVRVEQLVVLISKSGLGKSSLLNAGLLPRFQQESNYTPISLWFSSFRQKGDRVPLDLLISQIKGKNATGTFLDKIADDNNSLWYHLKTSQLTKNGDKGFLLIFDQFENFFTFPEENKLEFKQQLADALNVKTPQKLLRAYREKVMADPGFFSEEEKELFFKPLDIKVLFAIRSDKMNLLHGLKDVLPNVLKKTFELAPLNRIQAEDAIVYPAYKKDETFFSKPFDFSDEALTKILHFLTKNGELDEIESAQLQILCQYIEENIVIGKNKQIVEENDLGNISTIFSNYYNGIINGLPESDQRTVRVFVEEGLIFEEDERRLPLDERQIEKLFQVSDSSLKYLVNKRLLRSQPNQTGGFSYELSHDTLVSPILKAKHERVKHEAYEVAEKERKAKLLQIQNKKAADKKKAQRRKRSLLAIAAVIFMALIAMYFYLNQKKTSALNDELKKTQSKLLLKQDSLMLLSKSLKRSEQDANQAADEAKINEQIAIEKATQSMRDKLLAEKGKVRAEIEMKETAQKSQEKLQEKIWELNRNKAKILLENAREERAAKNYNEAKLYALYALRQSHYLSPAELQYELDNIRMGADYPTQTFSTDFTMKMKHFSVSPDEKWIASCGEEHNTIQVWGYPSGRIYRTFQSHTETVNATSFSPDSRLLASASDDKSIKIWSLESNTLLRSLNYHQSAVINVLFAPQGSLMASVSNDMIILWDTDNYQINTPFTDIAAGRNNIAFSEDGSYFAYVKSDYSIEVIRVKPNKRNLKDTDGKQIMNRINLAGHSGLVNCLSFSPNGEFLASGSSDNKVVITNLSTRSQRTLSGHTTKVTSLDFSRDGFLLASGDGSNTIKIWDLQDIYSASSEPEITQYQGLTEPSDQRGDKVSSIVSLHNHLNKIANLQFIKTGNYSSAKSKLQRQSNNIKSIQLISLGNGERQLKIWEFPKSSTVSVSHSDSTYIDQLIKQSKQRFNLQSSDGQQIQIGRSPKELLYEKAETAYTLTQSISFYDSILKIEPREYDAIYGLANAYYYIPDYRASAKYFIEYLDYFNQDYKTWSLLGICYYADLNFDEAILAYSKSITINPDYYWPFLYRGLAYAGKLDYQTALANYDTAFRMNPDIQNIHNYIGNAQLNLGDYEAAIYSYQIQTESQPENQWGWYNLAYAYDNLNDTVNAIKYYQLALEKDAALKDGWINLGRIYLNKHLYTKAANCFLKAAKSDSSYINSWYYLGNVALKGAYDYAITYSEKALKIDDTYAIVWNNLGMAYFKKGSYAEAAKAFEKTLDILPDDPTYLSKLALAYSHSGNQKRALSEYKRVIDVLNVTDSTNFNTFGFAFLKTGQSDKAREYLKKAEKKEPENPLIYRSWACLYAQNNQTGKALENLTKAVDLGYLNSRWFLTEPALQSIQNEDRLIRLTDRMKLEINRNKEELVNVFEFDERINEAYKSLVDSNYEAAIQKFEEAFSIQSPGPEVKNEYAKILQDYGLLLIEKQQYRKASAIFNKLLLFEPDFYSSVALNNLGNKFSFSNEDSLAVIYYLKSVDADATNAFGWSNLGYSYEKLKQTDKAKEAYHRAISISPYDSFSLNGLGLIYKEAGLIDSSIYYFESAVIANPDNSYSQNNLADTYLDIGNRSTAKAMYRTVVNMEDTNTYALDRLSFIYNEEKQYDSVIFFSTLAAQAHMESANGWGNLGWYYLFTKQYNEALSNSEHALEIDNSAYWVKVNIGHAFLLMGEFERAKKVYLEIADLLWEGESFRDIIIGDFEILSEAGLHQPDMERMMAILKEE